MRTIVVISVALFWLVSLSGCKKDEPYLPPEIKIISPESNAFYKLPGTVRVRVHVKSHTPLNYIRISFNNKELIPVLGQKFIYPSAPDTLIDYDEFIGNIPPGETGPFIFQVAVDDGKQVTRVFSDIHFEDAEMHYKGFYLFTRPGINDTRIDYYDSTNTASLFANLDGELVYSASSSLYDLLFVTTSIPSRLYAYQFEDQELQWTQTPEQPYPEYTFLKTSENLLYVAAENERISVMFQQSGYQKVTTGLLFDSIPERIGVNEDFFTGDFRLRNSTQRAWVTFYKTTGYAYRQFSTFIHVTDFYPFTGNSGFYVFGNLSGKAIFGIYHLEGNFLSEETPLPAGEITHTARLDYRLFLIADENALYRFDIVTKMTMKVKQFDEEIVDMELDGVNNRIFVAFKNKVMIFAYPNMELLNELPSEAPVKAIELKYYY